MVSPHGYCPNAEGMLFSIICTSVNWEVAALSYRKQDNDRLEETKTQRHPQKSEMVCHSGWTHATEPRSDFCLTIGAKKKGGGEREKENNNSKNPKLPKVRKTSSELSRFRNPFKADAHQTGGMYLELC